MELGKEGEGLVLDPQHHVSRILTADGPSRMRSEAGTWGGQHAGR